MHGKSELAIDYQHTARPIVAMAIDHASDWTVPFHRHRRAQLMSAERGVMVVNTAAGRWIVPPSRAVWIPAGAGHACLMLGAVRFRTVYVERSIAARLPGECRVVAVTPLLRELVLEAVRIPNSYAPDSREARIMRLIVDEIRTMEVLPLSLPIPRDRRARGVAERLLAAPDSQREVPEWAREAGTSPRHLERIFGAETGLSFGRWRRQARLQSSLIRLASGAGVLEAALAVGYENPSAYAAAFRRAFGVPPSGYFRPAGEATVMSRRRQPVV